MGFTEGFIQNTPATKPAPRTKGLWVQDSACTDYVKGCMKIPGSRWRTQNHQPDFKKMKRHTPKCIVIHHGGLIAGEIDPVRKMRGLYAFSVEADPKMGDVKNGGKPPWGDVPYHFAIDKFGNLSEGRDLQFQPDTNTRELNPTGKINILIDGQYDDSVVDIREKVRVNGHLQPNPNYKKRVPGDHLRPRQEEVLRQVVKHIQDTLKIKYVTAHKHLAHDTDCPGEQILKALSAVWTGCPD